MLAAYDLLLGKNQDVVMHYFDNIQNILADFCMATDSTRIMKANGKIFTDIKTQELNPNETNFINQSFSIAGSTFNVVSCQIKKILY